jgi:signal transduction histidine kinase/ActR/RegA family two-component response regulator
MTKRQEVNTGQRRELEELRQRSEELGAVLDTIPAYVWIAHDPECRVITGNRAANDMTKVARGTNVSQSVMADGQAQFFRQLKPDGSEYRPDELPLRQAIATGQSVRGASVEFCLADGRRVHTVGAAAPLFGSTGTIRGAIAAFFDITARKQAEEAVANNLVRMTRLQALSSELVQRRDTLTLLQKILATAAEVTGTDKGNIQTLNSATGKLRILVHQGLGQRLVEHFAEDGWSASCDAALKKRERVIVEDVTQVPGGAGTLSFDIILADGIRAIQSTPLIARDGRFLGMLNNHFRQPRRPTEAELRYVDLLARMAADLIERHEAEEALQEAAHRKDLFLATLAHELRNPLAPIRTAVHMLRLTGPAEPRLEWARNMIDRQVTHMVRLVDDLLDVSRISRGKIILQKEPVDLTMAVTQAVDVVRPLVIRNRQALTVSCAPDAIAVEADPARLVQVLSNLFNNAAKFTPTEGSITVSTEQSGDEAVIRVRDTGIGIAPELLAHVFDVFVQGDRALDRREGGLGIGLTLVRSVVEQHGGRVEGRSAGRGCGSEFIVTWPVARSPATAPTPPAVVSGEPGRRLRLLVVEDNLDAAESLIAVFRLHGHEVRTAATGTAALDVATRFVPDVAFIDVGLPEIDGYEVARRLRALPAFQSTVLIALSGYGQEEDRRRAREAGFDHHLTKPVDPTVLDGVLGDLAAQGERAGLLQ